MAENIKSTVEELRKLINVDNVIGTPIETEDKLLIPVMRMGVGFAAGEERLISLLPEERVFRDNKKYRHI